MTSFLRGAPPPKKYPGSAPARERKAALLTHGVLPGFSLEAAHQDLKAADLRFSSFKFRLVFVSVLVSMLVNRWVADYVNSIYVIVCTITVPLKVWKQFVSKLLCRAVIDLLPGGFARSRARQKIPRLILSILRCYTESLWMTRIVHVYLKLQVIIRRGSGYDTTSYTYGSSSRSLSFTRSFGMYPYPLVLKQFIETK